MKLEQLTQSEGELPTKEKLDRAERKLADTVYHYDRYTKRMRDIIDTFDNQHALMYGTNKKSSDFRIFVHQIEYTIRPGLVSPELLNELKTLNNKINIRQPISTLKKIVKDLRKKYQEEQTSNLVLPKINPKDMPEWIQVTPRNKTRNPYFKFTDKKYAGLPDGYPYWTSQMLDKFLTLKKLFTELNLPPLDMMYASGHEFLVLGVNGRFVWRKYGHGMGAQNIIVVDGRFAKAAMLNDGSSSIRQFLEPLTK